MTAWKYLYNKTCMAILLGGGWPCLAQDQAPSLASLTQASAFSETEALFLVAVCPSGKFADLYPAFLLQFEESAGVLEEIYEIFDESAGTTFVRPYYDQHLLIVANSDYDGSWQIGNPIRTRRYWFINTRDPAKPRGTTFNYKDDQGILGEYYVPDGTHGSLLIRVGVDLGKVLLLRRLRLGTGVVSEATPQLHWEVVISGAPLQGTFGAEDLSLRPSPEGLWVYPWMAGEEIESKWNLPPGLKMDKTDRALIFVNNQTMMALAPFGKRVSDPTGLGSTQLLLLDKQTNAWRSIEFLGGWTYFRGFGPWLAAHVGDVLRPDGNPGKEQRRQETSRYGRPADRSFEYWTIHLPGILQLYDSRTGKLYSMNTGQADSEILLVEGEVVYYRIYDELYQRSIGKEELGRPRLLVKAEPITHTHWAFLGPKVDKANE